MQAGACALSCASDRRLPPLLILGCKFPPSLRCMGLDDWQGCLMLMIQRYGQGSMMTSMKG